ncbi:MAG: TAXI family TRAP transporter solute-binding subunit [Tissierellia bacterium]|nr:TAXI family TRAP transporter solute-binding subunit [Tissierellia bacterium]
MKKRISILLALLLVSLTLFTACSSKEPAQAPAEQPTGGTSEPAETPAKSSTPANIILATGGTTGTYYSLGGTIAQLWNSHIDGMNVTAQSTGASIENCRLIGNNEAEIALLQNDVLDYAYNGIESFDGDGIDSLRAIGTLYPEVIQIVGRQDITEISELKGKKVSVGAPGSGTEANARQILGAAGITYDDLTVSYLSFSESADAYKDNQIDAFFVTSGVPNASIQDISAQNDISIIEVPADIAASVMADYPFYIEFNIPAGTYNKVEKDVNTVAILATLATSEEQPEDMVYELTKTLFENQPELANSHAKGKEISAEAAVEGVSIPFHAGAEKYFKEKGIL